MIDKILMAVVNMIGGAADYDYDELECHICGGVLICMVDTDEDDELTFFCRRCGMETNRIKEGIKEGRLFFDEWKVRQIEHKATMKKREVEKGETK